MGVVAEGVVFSDGSAVLRWVTTRQPHSTAVYQAVSDVERIHGHGSATQVRWLDPLVDPKTGPTPADYIRDSEEWGSP